MATATAIIARISRDTGEARIEVDYDDATDENNPDLISGRCINELAGPVTLHIQRGNGNTWFTIVVPPGETRSVNAGGPVRRLNDIPHLEIRA